MLEQEIAKLQQEIDNAVWRPFKIAFEARDGAALNSLYADTVLRATPEGIDTDEQFKLANLAPKANSDLTVRLDFWLENRRTNTNNSYEVGMFRITRYTETTTAEYLYGQFHIVIKKINGEWKITQDWDTDEVLGKKLNAIDFERIAPQF